MGEGTSKMEPDPWEEYDDIEFAEMRREYVENIAVNHDVDFEEVSYLEEED